MSKDPPRPVDVRGGSGGIVADCLAMTGLADVLGDVARTTLGAAADLHALLVDERLITSGLLDPGGFAEVEADLLAALDGPRGLTWTGGQCAALDLELRAAALGYRTGDEVAGRLADAVDGVCGAGPALAAGAMKLARTGDPVAAAEAVIAADPELGDVLVDVLGIPAALAAGAAALPDGSPVVRARGVDRHGAAGRPPRSLVDVVAGLAARDDDGVSGSVDVRILMQPDGSRRAIVDVTGTRSWDPLPTSDVTSLTTNGRALVGERTSYENGVLTAMRRAGVRSTDPVMLVGHSQGGMVAVTAARDAVRSGEFRVTHVVTAGSPIGLTADDVPSGVQVLALENEQDVVPHLDGRANPDRPNVTTVSGRRGDGTVLGDHSIEGSYLPLAGDAEATDDRSVRDFLSGADGYFRGTEVQTQTFQVRRSY